MPKRKYSTAKGESNKKTRAKKPRTVVGGKGSQEQELSLPEVTKTNTAIGKEGERGVEILTPARLKENKPLLIILPGSSGRLGRGMSSVFITDLSQYFSVRIREGKWRGWNPIGEANVQSVLDVCPPHNNTDDWYILGNSFGNRVVCAMFSEGMFHAPPKGLIMCGYPMYGPKCTDERVQLLQKLDLPEDRKLLCISGAKDEFLLRGGSDAQSVYESVLKGTSLLCNNQVEVRILPGGKHGVLDHSNEKVLAEASVTVVNWIRTRFELM